MKATQVINRSIRHLKRCAPTILTFGSAIGVVGTAVLAVRATPKAMKLCEDLECEHIENDQDEPTKLDYALVAWKPYVPAIAVGVSTIFCIFGVNVLSKRQQAALTSAYILLNRTYKEYQSKIESLYGKDVNRKIQTEIAKDNCKKLDLPDVRGTDTVLFYEAHYGSIFERTMLEVQDAEYRLNRKFSLEGEASLNDFFEYLGLPDNEIGDALGWSQEIICDYCKAPWIDFEHDLVELDDGLECYIINMVSPPTTGYSILF